MTSLGKYNTLKILLVGCVWATTDPILDEYMVVNVHPADLRVMKDERRACAGVNGAGNTLAASDTVLP
jgi:hypothetical protein